MEKDLHGDLMVLGAFLLFNALLLWGLVRIQLWRERRGEEEFWRFCRTVAAAEAATPPPFDVWIERKREEWRREDEAVAAAGTRAELAGTDAA